MVVDYALLIVVGIIVGIFSTVAFLLLKEKVKHYKLKKLSKNLNEAHFKRSVEDGLYNIRNGLTSLSDEIRELNEKQIGGKDDFK